MLWVWVECRDFQTLIRLIHSKLSKQIQRQKGFSTKKMWCCIGESYLLRHDDISKAWQVWQMIDWRGMGTQRMHRPRNVINIKISQHQNGFKWPLRIRTPCDGTTTLVCFWFGWSSIFSHKNNACVQAKWTRKHPEVLEVLLWLGSGYSW